MNTSPSEERPSNNVRHILQTPSELIRIHEERKEFHRSNCKVEGSYVTLKYSGYDYDIALSCIGTPERLLGWTLHLLNKSWFPSDGVPFFVKVVYNAKGWDISSMYI